MHNEFDREARDPFLAQAFANRSQPLPDGDFLCALVARVERAQRRQWVLVGVSLAAALCLLAVLAPWIAAADRPLTDFAVESLSALRTSIDAPALLVIGGLLWMPMLPILWLWWLVRE